MPTAKFLKKEYSKKEIEQKFKVDEYVFEIDGKDTCDVNFIYSID